MFQNIERVRRHPAAKVPLRLDAGQATWKPVPTRVPGVAVFRLGEGAVNLGFGSVRKKACPGGHQLVAQTDSSIDGDGVDRSAELTDFRIQNLDAPVTTAKGRAVDGSRVAS